MAGAESHLTRSLLAAARGRWEDVDWDRTRQEIRRYRDGSDAEPGSDNHPILTYCIALIVAWRRPDLLHRLGVTRQQVVSWWEREMTVRLHKGTMLTEARSRIYAGWEAVLICWCQRAFAAFPELVGLHGRYVRATVAHVALCAYPVRPLRYSPPNVEAKLFKAPIFVPLAGARSWSGERDGDIIHAHHLGQSAFEVFACGLLDIPIPREFEWERAMIDALKPGLMGLTRHEADVVRVAVRSEDPIVLEDLVPWLEGVGTRWPCRLIRFESGSACIGLDRAVNGNTAPIYTMAIHRDGTVHYLALDPGNRHDIDLEPCGVSEFVDGDHVTYVAWAGGESRRKRELLLDPARWGRVLWDVHLQRDGHHVVRRPLPAEPPAPPPEKPGPEAPKPGREDRDWYDYPGVWLTKLWRFLERRF